MYASLLLFCHGWETPLLCSLPSYDFPKLRKRLFRKATWTSSNSHKIWDHLKLFWMNWKPSRRTNTAISYSLSELFYYDFQLDWWWLPFVRYRILVFHQFCVTCFWLVLFFFLFFFIKYISIKSLGVKGYSFYFLTTINDMISQKKWGGNFSFPVVFVFIADYEKTSKWSDSWVEKGEKQCPIHLHTQVLQTYFCFSTNGFGRIGL